MALRASTTLLNNACNAAVDTFDVGSTNPQARLQFYTGTKPGTFGGAPGGTLLATILYANTTSFGNASGGSASAASVPRTAVGLDDGTIGWARVIDRNNNTVIDEDDVGTSGNAITVNTMTVSTGVDFNLNSHTFSVAP